MMNRASENARLSARRLQSRLREASLSLPQWRLPRWLRAPGDPADPSTAMFQRIRRSMALLYTLVLVVILLLAGTVLYLAVQQSVYSSNIAPAQQALRDAVTNLSVDWTRASNNPFQQSGQQSCPVDGPDTNRFIFACYDAHGAFTQASNYAISVVQSTGIPFTNTSLARSALNAPSGCSSDVTPGEYGDIMRYACVVHDPTTGQTLGVIQAGVGIGQTLEQLHALLVLLLIVGGFTVLLSALGGFILSARAMAPARLAYSRQQRFIGDVSHELRTPLTLLRADAEMLLRGRARLPEDDAELLDDIVDETARLAALTTSLLTLARLDSVSHLPERDTVDVAEVTTNVVRRTSAFAAGRQVTVRATAPDGLLVSGVRDLLDQAALILVDNAIKYNKPGGHVDVRAERRGERGERVALIVSDNGPGVEPEHLAHLGERFYRPDKARARQSGQDGGAGLGISIAHSVATLHGGSLSYVSVPGHGLTATLELPATRARRDIASDDPYTTDELPTATNLSPERPQQEPHDALLP